MLVVRKTAVAIGVGNFLEKRVDKKCGKGVSYMHYAGYIVLHIV